MSPLSEDETRRISSALILFYVSFSRNSVLYNFWISRKCSSSFLLLYLLSLIDAGTRWR